MSSLLQGFVARRFYFLAAGVVLILDQASKITVDQLLRGRGPVEVIPGLFNLWYSRNRGGLFGFLSSLEDPWRSVVLTLLPLIAIVLIAVFLARTDEPDRSTLFGLALILGGAVGNLIDRIIRGEVVDFLDVYASWPKLAGWLEAKFGTAHWPTFNLADSAIVIGVGLLILDMLRPASSSEAQATSEKDA